MSTQSGTASIDQLYAWLVELSLQVRQPDHVAAKIDQTLAIYAEKLTGYDPKRVERVLKEWADYNKFWPTWSELRSELEPDEWGLYS